MNSYSKLQRNIAKIAAISLLIFISPLSAVNAATGNISVVTEVSTPTNDVTPDYTFNSDSTGSIAYTGPCSSVLTTLVSTGNTTITLNSLPEGIYSTCTIQVDNGEGPSNLLTLATFIVDITAPIVTLTGSSPMTIFSGSTYIEPGASWIDPIYGTGDTFGGIYGNTGSFQSTGSVNTYQTGTYTIEYLKVDAAGNTGSVTRTVHVIEPDSVPPVVILSGSSTITIAHGSAYIDSGADWTDNIEGSGNTLFGLYADTGSFQSSGSVNTGALGVYNIEYLKVDTSGNTGSAIRTIIVTDQTAPVVTLSGSSVINIIQSGSYTELGANYTDNVDASGSILTVTSGSVNTSIIGTYILTYTHTDVAGNTGSINRTVVVYISDTTRPIVTLVGSGTQVIASGSIYTDLGASWTDNIDGSGNTLVGTYGNTGSFQSTGSVNTSQTGSYTITYLKIDAAGNTGSVTRTVTVISSITLSSSVSGTGSAVVSTGTVQPGTLIITNGNSITTNGSSGSSLSIPGSVNFLLSGSAWDGILYAPVLSTISILSIGDAGVVTNLPQDTPTTDYSYTVLPTLMAGGTGGTSVIASGGVFTLSMQINSPSVSSGTSLPVFRSNDSVTWVVNTPQSTCVLDSALMCTFTTDHLSYFGFVRVTSTPIAVVTPIASSAGPGGGGYSYSNSPNSSTISIGIGTDTITNNSVIPVSMPVRTNQGNNPRTTTSDSFLDDLFDDITDTPTIDNSSNSTDADNTSIMAPIGTAYVSVKNSLRVRAGTSFNTAVVAYIYRNQEIQVIDNDTPNWSRIQFKTAKGTIREGYILSYYVREMTNIDKIRDGIISFAEATMSMPEITGYINVAHSLNLRSGPSVYTRVKTILKPNTQVIILDTIGKWREIMTEKYHGYVLSKYIKQ